MDRTEPHQLAVGGRVGFSSTAKYASNGTIRLPFGEAKTSPVAAGDVGAVVQEILADPTRPGPVRHIDHIHEEHRHGGGALHRRACKGPVRALWAQGRNHRPVVVNPSLQVSKMGR